MTSTAKLTVIKVEDHEGDGECRACGRVGLRWIVTLSDGSQIGTECAKRLLGIKIAPKTVEWVSRYTAIESKTVFGEGITLWQHKSNPVAAAISRNGHLQSMGGIVAMRRDYDRW